MGVQHFLCSRYAPINATREVDSILVVNDVVKYSTSIINHSPGKNIVTKGSIFNDEVPAVGQTAAGFKIDVTVIDRPMKQGRTIETQSVHGFFFPHVFPFIAAESKVLVSP